MTDPNQPTIVEAEREALKEQWLNQLNQLMDLVSEWAASFGWSTRRISITMRDSQIGTYSAPALLLQEEATRMLLEPIGRNAPGAEGVVDLYVMPAYDDLARLFLQDGTWQVQYAFPGVPTLSTADEVPPRELSKETLRAIVDEMRNHAVR